MESDESTPQIRDTRDVPPEVILDLFRGESWSKPRTRESVQVALFRTPVVLTAWLGDRCVGMLRVLTDGVYRALIEDVIVHPDYRGRGFGRFLMEAALRHPQVRDAEFVILFATVPAFYERFGFVSEPHAMKLERPPGR